MYTVNAISMRPLYHRPTPLLLAPLNYIVAQIILLFSTKLEHECQFPSTICQSKIFSCLMPCLPMHGKLKVNMSVWEVSDVLLRLSSAAVKENDTVSLCNSSFRLNVIYYPK